ncbi:MAG TPA: glycosyltransferase family 39 protein [Saprospiraceae bacterium]|nr:glycosyltransferase family 39 protein [Saprospiraceae bacterium]
MTKNTLALLILFTVLLFSIIMHLRIFTLPIQGKDTWRQSKTGWTIRNFVRHDANIFNPRQGYLTDEGNIERYEFPIMQWSIAMIEKVTGEHILILRLCVYLISLLTLLAVYKLAFLLSEDQVTSAIAVFMFVFFPTFFYNATSIMPDNIALCFGMFYVLFFFRYLKSGMQRDLIYAGIFIALAGLAKLPFILLGALALVRFVEILFNRQPNRWRDLTRFTMVNILALLPPLIWYAIVIPDWRGNNIAAGFTKDFVGWPLFLSFLQDQIFKNFSTEILNPPSLVIFFIGVYYCIRDRLFFFVKPVYFYIPLLVLFMYFFYVLNVIREGHDYYLLPFYPVFVLPVILALHKIRHWKNPAKIFIAILILAMPVVCWLRVKNYWDIKFAYFNHDFFNCRDQLNTIGTRDDKVIVINDQSFAIFLYILDKQGYVFWNDNLPVGWIRDIIKRHGTTYLFSDSRIIENQERFNECISEMVLECGTIRVFRLKKPDEIHD